MPAWGQDGLRSRAGRESGKFSELHTGVGKVHRPEAVEVSGRKVGRPQKTTLSSSAFLLRARGSH